jgi:tRNA G18 (ribose-2'-O)-methylase SpoU
VSDPSITRFVTWNLPFVTNFVPQLGWWMVDVGWWADNHQPPTTNHQPLTGTMLSVGIVRLDGIDDERLSAFRSVPDPALLARLGVFVAEGRLVVRRLLADSRLEARALLVTEPALASIDDLLADRPALPVYVVTQEVLNGAAGFNFHRGCLAIGVRPPARHWREVAAGASRLVVLERVGNADNVGAIFRNASAFGTGGVLLQSDCADPLYRKSIRTSMAASLSIPFAAAEPWPAMLEELRGEGWTTVALTPAAGSPVREEMPRLAGSRIAIVLGHEGEGLSPEAMAACTHRARIPMAQGIDSVNVATAAAIALYEMGA